MIRIDGSMGEGGGQILRSSLSLSLVTGKPFCIENIRSKRERSGLLRQHLTGVLAAAEIGEAQVEVQGLGRRNSALSPEQFAPEPIASRSEQREVGHWYFRPSCRR